MKTPPDLRVEPVEGAPISLQKFVENAGKLEDVTVVVNGTGLAMVNDMDGAVDISIAAREKQADYFFSLGVPMPPHLRRYLKMMYEDEDVDVLYKYGATNPEFRHIVSLIQMVGGALNIARKANKGVRLYVEEPESRLHPKRVYHLMSMINALRDEYGNGNAPAGVERTKP